MNIIYIILIFIGILILLYVILAFLFFGRNYKIKTDKMFSDAIKSILENPGTEIGSQDGDLSKDKVSIKKLVEDNHNFRYLKGEKQNAEAKNGKNIL